MISVWKSVFKEKAKELQLGTSFQCLNLFTGKLLHNQRNKQVERKIKEIPWHLEFLFASHFSR